MLVDLTNATASLTLGLTLNCAQCHDHKFDPISIQDYYRFQGFFVKGQVNRLLLKDPALWKAYQTAVQSDLEVLKPAKQLNDLLYGPLRSKLAEEAKKKLLPELIAALGTPASERTPEQAELARKAEKEVEISSDKVEKALKEEDRKFFKELDKKINTLEKELHDKKPHTWGFYSPATSPHPVETLPPLGVYPLLYEPEKLKAAKPQWLKRGDIHQPGSELKPGWPEILGPMPEGGPAESPRLALVDWLTSRKNPLLSRVWVNYVWQQHFGRGLMAASGDFGVLIPPPKHSELLDWLATEFRENGWSTKHLHRLIVLSSTYRQASQTNSKNAKLDPENYYWWRWLPRRLEAESIRDSVLAVSGELDRELGGPSVSFGASSAEDGGELDPTFAEQKLGPNQFAAKPRRSLYMRQLRDNLPVMQKLFDGPSASETCPRRHVSTVALQPLYLLNNPFILKQAELFAARVLARAGSDTTRQIETAFVLALGRPPKPAEMDAVRRFLDAHRTAESSAGASTGLLTELRRPAPAGTQPVTRVAKMVRQAGDVQGGTVKPLTTAETQLATGDSTHPPLHLVHLCHALFSLNEFVYVE